MSTPLMTDPIDHWLDVTQRPIRRPLLMEMMTAYDQALASPVDPPHRRACWTGVGLGYAVAFGFMTREALHKARRVPGALCVHPDEFHPTLSADEETAWASGLLYGYYMGTSEGLDVTTCEQCGQRLVYDLDETARCHHGDFCPDCISDWHANTSPSSAADVCSYEDGRGWE